MRGLSSKAGRRRENICVIVLKVGSQQMLTGYLFVRELGKLVTTVILSTRTGWLAGA